MWLDEEAHTHRAYIAGVFFTESGTAKAVMFCLAEVVSRLQRMSAIMQRAGVLGEAALRAACFAPGRPCGCPGGSQEPGRALHAGLYDGDCAGDA